MQNLSWWLRGNQGRVRGVIGVCLWKGLDIRVTTQWTDPPPAHHTSTPTQKNSKFMLYTKLLPKSLDKPRQLQEWLGVSIERYWPQGQHKMDGPHPTHTPHKQNQCFMQNLSRRIWRTKAGTRVIGVSIERSWHQGHHTMDGPPPHPTPPTPTPKNTKSMLYTKLVSKSLDKPRQVQGWLGCP